MSQASLYSNVGRAVRGLLVLCVASAGGCGKLAEPEPKPAAAVALTQASPDPAFDPQAPMPAEERPEFMRQGFRELSIRDELPLCVFSSVEERAKAGVVDDVKPKLRLRANEKLVFGVFPPWCLNEACDARANLQCYLEARGNTIIVSSRFFSFHKEGASCSGDCLEVDSSCQTTALSPGKYEVRHGDKTYKLQIPGTLRDACLNRR
jgi:hypothetical protein